MPSSMDESAIVNASPIIVLSRSGHGQLLRAVLGRIIVPMAVVEEVEARGGDDVTARFLRDSAWIEIQAARAAPESVEKWRLGRGESAVITIALTTPDALAVLDDLDARRCATAHGVRVRGTVGLVVRAGQLGVIPSAREVLGDILLCGFRISDELIDAALRRVGE